MLPFNIPKSDLAKLEVLETKFSIYEDLSRQMVDKLEAAVNKITEANNNIATILVRHDQRIEQTIKNDESFSKQIESLKLENKEEHRKVLSKINELESKIQDFIKFRWIIMGAVIIISFMFSQSSFVVRLLTHETPAGIIQEK